MAREREKINRPNTLPAVRRTKGLSNFRKELAGGELAYPGRRQEAGGRGEGKGAKPAPEMASFTTLQTGLQFLTKDLMRFWMVDIHWEGRG